MITKHDYRIASASRDYEILLRNKNASDAQETPASNIVLFVHGATYGSTSTFDYPIDGVSWMDHMAAQGFDAWCLDLLGYGGSDRPAEMDEPNTANSPLVDTVHAIAEVRRAVEFILEKRRAVLLARSAPIAQSTRKAQWPVGESAYPIPSLTRLSIVR